MNTHTRYRLLYEKMESCEAKFDLNFSLEELEKMDAEEQKDLEISLLGPDSEVGMTQGATNHNKRGKETYLVPAHVSKTRR